MTSVTSSQVLLQKSNASLAWAVWLGVETSNLHVILSVLKTELGKEVQTLKSKETAGSPDARNDKVKVSWRNMI